jgi:GTP diphosphokinase / guanosine-3',5'-bis(diphosphate) 3'-diphosphatase
MRMLDTTQPGSTAEQPMFVRLAGGLGLVLNVAAYAGTAHSKQRRKDENGAPYINHPLAVARVLAHEVGVTDAITLCAALLHDTIEDTAVTYNDLVARFGADIADVVREVSDDKTLSKAARKLARIESASHLSDRARLVVVADKVCNIRDLMACPIVGWGETQIHQYVEWAGKVCAGARGVNAALDALFDAEVSNWLLRGQTASVTK